MKLHLRSLLALLMAALLALSAIGVAEGALSIEDNALAPEGLPLEAGPDVPEAIDGALPLPEDLPAPEAAVEAAEDDTSVNKAPAAEAATNALVKKVTIGVKEKYTIDTGSLKGTLTFKSSKKAVAAVTGKGVVTGKKAGTARITIKTSKGKKYTVTVTVAKAPTKVTLNKKKATLETGDTLQLKATLPGKTASYKLTWTSSNKAVATVSSKGKVTAKGEGTATITVKTFNGKKATCKITVEDEEKGYTGDILDAIGTDVDIFSDAIDDPLTLYSYDDDYITYINGYMMVTASYSDNSILAIMLNSGDKNGKYTINKMHPGNNLVLTRMQAEDAGWEYWKTEGTRYWYEAWYEGETIYLIITSDGNSGSSTVNYVTIMRVE